MVYKFKFSIMHRPVGGQWICDIEMYRLAGDYMLAERVLTSGISEGWCTHISCGRTPSSSNSMWVGWEEPQDEAGFPTSPCEHSQWPGLGVVHRFHEATMAVPVPQVLPPWPLMWSLLELLGVRPQEIWVPTPSEILVVNSHPWTICIILIYTLIIHWSIHLYIIYTLITHWSIHWSNLYISIYIQILTNSNFHNHIDIFIHRRVILIEEWT